MKFLLGFLLAAITLNLKAQNILYKCDDFQVLSDRVKQGLFTAEAKSDYELTSDYKSSFKTPSRRKIEIKFSINGLDNERGFAENHTIYLTSNGGKGVSPVFVFGKPDKKEDFAQSEEKFLSEDIEYTIRVDMREVLNSFKTKGFFTAFNGDKILQKDFKGVYVAGSSYPLTWDFESLPAKPAFKLNDKNNDGIYEVTLLFPKEYSEGDAEAASRWKLSQDISAYPKLESRDRLINALYNKALEEMLLNVRDDGAFMAGAKWPGVWTRDISYSIYLSLAIINPDACKTSLMAKVKNKRIIQDTGTGGSWPVSSDRMVWALAAWEIYAVTGDKNWLKESYEIIENSADDDLKTVRSSNNGLFYGESSFLDWREQTYPLWADPVDIYNSQCLGTNAIHFQTYVILEEMAKELGKPAGKYQVIAGTIKEKLNQYFWINERGYYGQYLYGRTFPALSTKSETLGEALAVIFGIASPEQQKTIVRSVPVINYGTPVIFPQIPNIPPYHNNSIWPFVQAFWTLAAAKGQNEAAVLHSLASIYRASALFLTNKENMTASTGHYMGTEINSDRQLWSVAGILSSVYRVLFGMQFTPSGLELHPFVPANYAGIRTLKNFKYREAFLDITIDGFGNEIDNIMLDGKFITSPVIPAALNGKHTLIILLKNKIEPDSKINMTENITAPAAPEIKIDKNTIMFAKIPGAEKYILYKNGKQEAESSENFFVIEKGKDYSEYQALAQDARGYNSFLCEPLVLNSEANTSIIQAEGKAAVVLSVYPGYTGSGYVSLEKGDKNELQIEADIPEDGLYRVDFRYSNGNGPVNTDNKCAIRTLMLDKKAIGPVVMPHKGELGWTKWGFTNPLIVSLKKGKNNFSIAFRESDNNMNGEVNSALIDYMRLTILK
jgi:hypothetical protein